MRGHDFTGAPCQQEPELWESSDIWDHVEARQGCTRCPHLGACEQLRREVYDESHPHGRPRGTWAGRFFDARGQYVPPPTTERPPEFTYEQAKAAHSQYETNRVNKAKNSDWVMFGERAYQRMRNRKRAA